jgi:WD40 repeat protein
MSSKEQAVLSEHRGAVNRVAFSADGKSLVSSSFRDGVPHRYIGEVKLWDATTGHERVAVPGEFSLVYSLALGPDGKTLALVGAKDFDGDPVVRVLHLPDGRERFRHHGKGHSFRSVD